MTADEQEYRDWKSGFNAGSDAYTRHQPYRDNQQQSCAHRRGYQDGWTNARRHEAECREDWALIERNEHHGGGL